MDRPELSAILVVGHHHAVRLQIKDILEQAGFKALECETGEAARAILAHGEVQLAVSIDVPEVEFSAILHAGPSGAASEALPVFYLSSGGSDGQRESLRPRELVANVRALLRVRAAEEQARARLKDMTHLHEISTRISKSLDLSQTLQEVLAAVLELQTAPMGALLLYDGERQVLHPAASISMNSEALGQASPLPLGMGASERAVAERRPIVVEDVNGEASYADFLEFAGACGFCSVYSVPLLTQQEEALGAITTCWQQPHRPSHWEMHLVELYARHAANAIENAQLYRRLQQEDRNKDEFLAMLAHELRNPLAPIMNASHVLRLHAPANDTLLWAITMVERQTRHLTHLVDDLLDVSRITRGKIELHRELVTLRAIMQNAAEASRPVVADRGHQFVVELPAENLWLDADPTRLEQIINNLLHNAAKYTPRGGRVVLSAGREQVHGDFPQGAAVIRVRDSGIGIAPEMLSRVFDVFSQADRTLDRAEGGLGLGLTLVRRLAEMHDGTVEAHSEGLGRGSEFILRLPLVPLSPETFEARPHPEHQQELDALQEDNQNGRRVLVVDDQVDTAQSLAELLEIWGHQVRVGFDGPSGVELAADFQPEVVLLDIGLPLMNGYEVARRLRETHGQEMMLVAMTGYGQEEDRRRALEAGFDLHMTKPVDLGQLRELITSASRI